MQGARFPEGPQRQHQGPPFIIREVQETAEELTPALISNLFDIATDERANASARVQASVALLDRGWGKPKQSVDVRRVDHNASGLANAIAAAQERMRVQASEQQARIIEGTIIDAQPAADACATNGSMPT